MSPHNRGERSTRDGFDSTEDRLFLSSSRLALFQQAGCFTLRAAGTPAVPSPVSFRNSPHPAEAWPLPILPSKPRPNVGLVLAVPRPGHYPCGLRRFVSSFGPLLASLAWPRPQNFHQSLAQHWSNVSLNDTDGCHTTAHWHHHEKYCVCALSVILHRDYRNQTDVINYAVAKKNNYIPIKDSWRDFDHLQH